MENTKESLAGLMIGYKFKRPALLAQALTHPSYAEEGGAFQTAPRALREGDAPSARQSKKPPAAPLCFFLP